MHGCIDGFDAKAPWYIRLVMRPMRGWVLSRPMSPGFQLPPDAAAVLMGLHGRGATARHRVERLPPGAEISAGAEGPPGARDDEHANRIVAIRRIEVPVAREAQTGPRLLRGDESAAAVLGRAASEVAKLLEAGVVPTLALVSVGATAPPAFGPTVVSSFTTILGLPPFTSSLGPLS